MSVPNRMLLSAKMEAAQITKALLTALNIDTESPIPTIKQMQSSTADKVIKSHTGKYGSVCFVVRRPGWVLCREQGQQLTDLATDVTGTRPMDGFELFGLVKETGVDDEGLTEFYKDSFNFPLYKDQDLVFYNEFFGQRKLKLTTLNPYRLYRAYKDTSTRLKEKQLEGNMVGEGMVQGGIIIFGKDGKAKYAYEEETGSEVPMDDIVAALNAVKAGKDEL